LKTIKLKGGPIGIGSRKWGKDREVKGIGKMTTKQVTERWAPDERSREPSHLFVKRSRKKETEGQREDHATKKGALKIDPMQ